MDHFLIRCNSQAPLAVCAPLVSGLLATRPSNQAADSWHGVCHNLLTKLSTAMFTNLTELYHNQLQDLFSAETQMIDALPSMIEAASTDRLKEAFSHHLTETKTQKERLERLCVRHGISPANEECQAMKGLLKEASQGACRAVPGKVRDALLIAEANRIEHYEIAGYGVAKAFAECLELDHDVVLLGESLEEEAAADRKLTEMATGSLFRNGINEAADR